MKRPWRFKLFLILVPLFLTCVTLFPDEVYSQGAIRRSVTGTVMATDSRAIPNTIVVKAKNWKGEELIVGAQVQGDTEITIDGRTARLGEIVSGDKVSMVYLREPTKLVAKSIEVKRR